MQENVKITQTIGTSRQLLIVVACRMNSITKGPLQISSFLNLLCIIISIDFHKFKLLKVLIPKQILISDMPLGIPS